MSNYFAYIPYNKMLKIKEFPKLLNGPVQRKKKIGNF